jgi:hypothetical protein
MKKLSAAEAQIAKYLRKYSPGIALELEHARSRLRSLFPRGFELVYDNYNALAIGYASSERAGDAVLSIAGYPRWVTLFFLYGKKLDDPLGLLQGSGSRVRSIRLASAADIGKPAIKKLIKQALFPSRAKFRDAPALTTVVKSVSAKQRSRRSATIKKTARKVRSP